MRPPVHGDQQSAPTFACFGYRRVHSPLVAHAWIPVMADHLLQPGLHHAMREAGQCFALSRVIGAPDAAVGGDTKPGAAAKASTGVVPAAPLGKTECAMPDVVGSSLGEIMKQKVGSK
ncbi:uncharacterized protein LOC121995683 [Zingiber officinale]|uniref:uncharacterized protein LOC121995683 n=1 Tax=Zingiber officinale TaxID=94328 RepID=UPI001C4CE9D9|nr:uncharacterized protein LOC121995683 [Zingiber officinale]